MNQGAAPVILDPDKASVELLDENEVHKILYGKPLFSSNDDLERSISSTSSLPLREKRLRRFDLTTRTRDETIQIGTYRRLQRDDFLLESSLMKEAESSELKQIRLEREKRWRERLKSSPFTQDLATQRHQAILKAAQIDKRQQQEKLIALKAHEEEMNEVFKRAVADTDLMNESRKEKRKLIEKQKLLKAKRDCAKTEARAGKVVNEKLQSKLEILQTLLERELLKS